MDYIHWYKRSYLVESNGPFKVSPQGFGCDFITTFNYIKRHGLCPKIIYSWVGRCIPTDPTQPIMYDRKKDKWDGATEVGTHKVQYVSKFTVHTFFKKTSEF